MRSLGIESIVGYRRLADRRPRHCARSGVEHEPAQLVAQPLVVEDQLPDRFREPGTLPPALGSTRLDLVARCGRPSRPDRVGRSPELVGGHVTHGRRLAGSVGSVPSRPAEIACRRVRMTRGGPGFGPGDLASGPGARELDRPTRSVVIRSRPIEVVQHVLGAIGGP
jgi:hypothetical protein